MIVSACVQIEFVEHTLEFVERALYALAFFVSRVFRHTEGISPFTPLVCPQLCLGACCAKGKTS